MTDTLKNSPLFKKLTGNHKEILASRANLLAQSLESEQSSMVKKIQNDLLRLKMEQESLMDFHPDQTTSLRLGSKDFDAGLWVEKANKVSVAIIETEVRLKAAQDLYNTLFAVEEAPAATEA